MNRDREEFGDYLRTIGKEDSVQYHVGFNFTSNPRDLFIIDESDVHLFGNPSAFKVATLNNRCICLTGSPDNKDD
jgi:hypothetical protein